MKHDKSSHPCPACGRPRHWYKLKPDPRKKREYVCIRCEVTRAERSLHRQERRQELLNMPIWQLACRKGYSDMLRVYPVCTGGPDAICIDANCTRIDLIRNGYKPRLEIIEKDYPTAEAKMRRTLMKLRDIK